VIQNNSTDSPPPVQIVWTVVFGGMVLVILLPAIAWLRASLVVVVLTALYFTWRRDPDARGLLLGTTVKWFLISSLAAAGGAFTGSLIMSASRPAWRWAVEFGLGVGCSWLAYRLERWRRPETQ
jgi:hypothetical protein